MEITDADKRLMETIMGTVLSAKMNEFLDELEDRCRRAETSLRELSLRRTGPEGERLHAKASGVSLVRSYLSEYRASGHDAGKEDDEPDEGGGISDQSST